MRKLWLLILILLLLLLLLLWWLLHGGGTSTAEGKVVFVSSQTYDGNFGAGQMTLGHLEADNRCQALADQAGLSGTFKAWISGRVDTGAGPLPHGVVDRFTQAAMPYRLVDGTQVAADWADLTDGTLDHAISLTESGNPVGNEVRVWTNTTVDGRAADNGRTCAAGPSPDIPGSIASWSCGPPAWSPQDCQFQSGRFGLANASNASWTGSSNTSCSTTLHLYCVQQ